MVSNFSVHKSVCTTHTVAVLAQAVFAIWPGSADIDDNRSATHCVAMARCPKEVLDIGHGSGAPLRVFEKLPLLRFCWDDDAFGHAAQNVLGLSVPSTLNSFMLAHAQNKHSALPSGYNIPSLSVVRHEATGITVQCPPIVVSPVGEDSIVIYHYCRPPTSNGRYDYLRPSCGPNAHYGEGVYATRKAPDNFSSKDDILLNNFTNKIDPDEQERQIKMRRIQGDADYCVPLVVPRSLAIDVRHQKSSEMKQPGQDIHGRPIRNGRDIWLVVKTTRPSLLVTSRSIIISPIDSAPWPPLGHTSSESPFWRRRAPGHLTHKMA